MLSNLLTVSRLIFNRKIGIKIFLVSSTAIGISNIAHSQEANVNFEATPDVPVVVETPAPVVYFSYSISHENVKIFCENGFPDVNRCVRDQIDNFSKLSALVSASNMEFDEYNYTYGHCNQYVIGNWADTYDCVISAIGE